MREIPLTPARIHENPQLSERPGRARLAVGGPASGVVVSSQSYLLTVVEHALVAKPDSPANLAEGVPVAYDPVTVEWNGASWRTWRRRGDSRQEHAEQALLLLIGLDPHSVEKIMVDRA